jgi:hypothetical protein
MQTDKLKKNVKPMYVSSDKSFVLFLTCSKSNNASKYVVDKVPLGRGSFGVVYKASLMKKDYAMKVLVINRVEDCLDEVVLQCKLKHKNIVEIFDFYTGTLLLQFIIWC